MGYNLFLDDTRFPEEVFLYTKNSMYLDLTWDLVHNYDEFIEIIQRYGIPDVISFDHDLADQHYQMHMEHNIDYYAMTEYSGYHCAKWLIEYCIDNKLEIPKTVLIHSWNQAGSKNIESLFVTYEKLYRGT